MQVYESSVHKAHRCVKVSGCIKNLLTCNDVHLFNVALNQLEFYHTHSGYFQICITMVRARTGVIKLRIYNLNVLHRHLELIEQRSLSNQEVHHPLNPSIYHKEM